MAGDFVLAFLVLGSGVLVLFFQSARKDLKDAEVKAVRSRAEEAEAREEARKYEPGAELVCLGCNQRFPSPLTETGCPECHLSSLVVTEVQLGKQAQ